MKPDENLRGRLADAMVDGRLCRVVVVTHVRGDKWLVDGMTLPKQYERGGHYWRIRRTVVTRDALQLVPLENQP